MVAHQSAHFPHHHKMTHFRAHFTPAFLERIGATDRSVSENQHWFDRQCAEIELEPLRHDICCRDKEEATDVITALKSVLGESLIIGEERCLLVESRVHVYVYSREITRQMRAGCAVMTMRDGTCKSPTVVLAPTYTFDNQS